MRFRLAGQKGQARDSIVADIAIDIGEIDPDRVKRKTPRRGTQPPSNPPQPAGQKFIGQAFRPIWPERGMVRGRQNLDLQPRIPPPIDVAAGNRCRSRLVRRPWHDGITEAWKQIVPIAQPDRQPPYNKLPHLVSRSKTMLIFLNQIRLKIGVMFGNPETTTGGNALKFYASIRLEIRRIGQIKDREEVLGNQTRVKVVKNKLAPPFRQVEFDIMYGEGVSKVGELIDLGVKAAVVEKSGAWFSYDSQRIGQGRENAKSFLREHRELADAIERRVREQSGVVANTMLAFPDDGEEAEAAD